MYHNGHGCSSTEERELGPPYANDPGNESEDASDASSLSHSAPTAPPTRIRTLDSHTKFGKAMKEALRRKGWSKDDKSDKDFFDHIHWTPTADGKGSKNARSSGSRLATLHRSRAGSKRSAPRDDGKDAAGLERPAKRLRTEPSQAKKENPRRVYDTRSKSKSQMKSKSSAARKGSIKASVSKPRLTRASSKASGSKPRS